MPSGTVNGAVSVGVLPFSLSTKFQETHAVQLRGNEYHDGTIQRTAMVNTVRRTWKLAKRLTASEMVALRTFIETYPADAFYFYNPTETTPAFSWDPSGVATPGRYLVRFNSDWSQTMDIARGDASIELIEVADDDDAENDGHGPITSSILSVWTAFNRNGHTSAGFEVCQYSTDGGSTWSNLIFGGVGDHSSLETTATISLALGLSALRVQFYSFGTLPVNPADNDLDVYDCFVELDLADGSTVIARPTAYTTSTPSGTVSNPANAFDSDSNPPTTYARVNQTIFGPFVDPTVFTVIGFLALT